MSVFAICDGRAIVPFAGACDYKRAGDGDTGPNTGGMGAYSPPAGFPDDLYDCVRERILAPLLRGLLAEGEEYVGVLYCGLMWTRGRPARHRVQRALRRSGDAGDDAAHRRRFCRVAALCGRNGAIDLSATTILPQYCAGVVLATADYPRSSTPLDLSASASLPDGCQVFWGGSKRSGGKVSSRGGRVLTVTALGDDLEQARARAYENVKTLAKRLDAAGLTYRTDIGKL